jgi:L-malate glycosyltransferase
LQKDGGNLVTSILFYESRPEWGGAQKCELDLLLSLENDQVKTYFLTSTDGPMISRLKDAGKEPAIIQVNDSINKIRKGQVKTGIFFLIQKFLYLLPHFIGVLFFILKNRIDIVYTSQFRSQLIVGWLAKLLGRKVVWHIHGEEKLDNLLGKFCVTFSDKIIVVSEKLKDQYCGLFPKQKDKFHAVHNGIEIPTLTKNHSIRPFTISIVGTIIEGKRQDLAIRACGKLRKMGYSVHLNIIGEKPPWHSDDYKDTLARLIEKFDMADAVTFTGWVENPYAHLIDSNAFILPSDTEGLPLSIIEAMALGLPCISTNVGGVPELIDDEKTGFIINPGSEHELMEKLKFLIEHPSSCERMGQEARNRYETYFTKASFVKGVAGVLNTIK